MNTRWMVAGALVLALAGCRAATGGAGSSNFQDGAFDQLGASHAAASTWGAVEGDVGVVESAGNFQMELRQAGAGSASIGQPLVLKPSAKAVHIDVDVVSAAPKGRLQVVLRQRGVETVLGVYALERMAVHASLNVALRHNAAFDRLADTSGDVIVRLANLGPDGVSAIRLDNLSILY